MMMVSAASSSATAVAAAALVAVVAYDSDDELPDETVSDRLLWRLDPEDSKSDWTIQIIVVNSSKKNAIDDENSVGGIGSKDNNKNPVVETYHVHTLNLTVGPRRCEYFCHLLHGGGGPGGGSGGRFFEFQTNTSRIELHELAAQQFPVFLDYLYSSEKDNAMSITTANVTALYSLAKYFQSPRLQHLAKKFWKVDIKRSDTCEIYYEHATLLQEVCILQAATRSFKENLMNITTSSRLLQSAAYIQLWLDVENDPGYLPKTQAYSLHLSQLMARLFQNVAVESHVFLQLTNATFLSQIQVDAAVVLLDVHRRRNYANTSSTSHGLVDHSRDADDSPPHLRRLIRLDSLQERCVQSIISSWREKGVPEDSPTMRLLCRQSPLIIGRILANTTGNKRASREIHQFNNSYKSLVEDAESLQRSNAFLQGRLDSNEQNHAILQRKYTLLEQAHGALQRKYNILKQYHAFFVRCGVIYNSICAVGTAFFWWLLAMICNMFLLVCQCVIFVIRSMLQLVFPLDDKKTAT
jgi:BTB/POZ domain